MAISPVKSYTYPGSGLRSTNATGPLGQRSPYPNMSALLSGGLRGSTATGPTPVGYNTGITAGHVDPSKMAQTDVLDGSKFAPPTPDELSQDPILQQIRAAGLRNVQDARAGALSTAEQDLVGYGAANIPASIKALYASDSSNPILAALADTNTAAAAEANPDSTLKQLARTNTQNNAGIDQGENAANLFYSSDRGNKLGAEAGNYRTAQDTAAQNLAQLLGQANGGVLQAEQQAQGDYLNGLQGAWDRWLSLQQLLGPTPSSTPTPDPTGDQPPGYQDNNPGGVRWRPPNGRPVGGRI